MSDRFNFSFQNVQDYITRMFETVANKNLKSPSTNTASVLSIFDTNFDGKISKKEFEGVTEEQYNKFVAQLEQYNKANSDDFNSKIFTFKELKDFMAGGHISMENLESEGFSYNLRDKNLQETKKLPEPEQMSNEDIIAELKEYGVDNVSTGRKKLLNTLNDQRWQRALFDEGSDEVDGHIGTYNQPNGSMMCSLLAQLDTMTDEEISKLYTEKTDNNGKKYYEVKFPNAPSSVTVTAEEIDNGEITLTEDGEERVFSDFTTGDADVRMFEMAYLKAFGAELMERGDWAYNTQNNLNSDTSVTYNYTQRAEDITDYTSIPRNTIFSILTPEEQAGKNLSSELELSNGQKLTITPFNDIKISGNGQSYTITPYHALQFRGYDSEAKEIILSGNSANNLSEIRLPADPKLLGYFQLDTRVDELKTN